MPQANGFLLPTCIEPIIEFWGTMAIPLANLNGGPDYTIWTKYGVYFLIILINHSKNLYKKIFNKKIQYAFETIRVENKLQLGGVPTLHQFAVFYGPMPLFFGISSDWHDNLTCSLKASSHICYCLWAFMCCKFLLILCTQRKKRRHWKCYLFSNK